MEHKIKLDYVNSVLIRTLLFLFQVRENTNSIFVRASFEHKYTRKSRVGNCAALIFDASMNFCSRHERRKKQIFSY